MQRQKIQRNEWIEYWPVWQAAVRWSFNSITSDRGAAK
jgi:hypothetical protein